MRRIPQRYFFILLLLSLVISSYAQEFPLSIHYEQSEYYRQFGPQSRAFYDSINNFTGLAKKVPESDCQLKRIIFGFHPYWAGSDHLNYRWDLISDLCYFSFEVDPLTGGPDTYHDWLTDPAIDSAKAHDVRVHLCATIFSGHAVFFKNPAARMALISNLVTLLQQRNADGVNMDIEAVPASLRDSITLFMRDLSLALKAVKPDAMTSIDLPAVDWNNAFDINGLDPYVDLFFIMAYDYYWNESAEAGPVSPLYSLTSGYNYSLARTVSAFEAAGVKPGKFILGVPYYGRQWKTQSAAIPSPVQANGSALTYSSIRNNSSIYNSSVYTWEPNSLSSCYIFFQNGSWNQCFIGLDRDLRKKYDLANYRNLAGIGMWALGYDDGYPELWQAISDKFTDCFVPLDYDTLFDSGGPARNYYGHENYTMTIDHGHNDYRYLTFSELNLEENFDSLWLYSGPDTTFPLLGGFSGKVDPETFASADGAFTLKFKSDGLHNAPGWRAVYHDGSQDCGEKSCKYPKLEVYPNPADNKLNIDIPYYAGEGILMIFDGSGKIILTREFSGNQIHDAIKLNITLWPAGIYLVTVYDDNGHHSSVKFLKSNF